MAPKALLGTAKYKVYCEFDNVTWLWSGKEFNLGHVAIRTGCRELIMYKTHVEHSSFKISREVAMLSDIEDLEFQTIT